jgi:hypothetical protein
MMIRHALTGTVLATLLASGVLAAVPAHADASAASGCRDAERSITGASVSGYFCWNENKVWFAVNSDAYLTDTAKDGRRAELWSRDRWQGTLHQGDVTGGVGDKVSLAGYGWSVLKGSPASTELRLCTSKAGANRKCGAWY